MTVSNVQERLIDAIVANPDVSRADVLRQPNGEVEVRLYGLDGSYLRSAFVKPRGEYAVDLSWSITWRGQLEVGDQ